MKSVHGGREPGAPHAGGRFPDIAGCWWFQHGTRGPHRGLRPAASSCREWAWLLNPREGLHLQAPEQAAVAPSDFLPPSGWWGLVETRHFGNSNHLPHKDNYFTL